MELKEALEKLTPNDYNQFLKRIEISDSYLKKLQFSVSSHSMTTQASYSLKENLGNVSIVEDKATIEINYEIKASSTDKEIFQLGVQYILNYDIQGELPEEFYVIFKHYTAPLQCFPYLRELVHSMTSRMGLSPLILPLRKVLIEKPKETEKVNA
ncbi:MAG: protein-export chaperone SecB [candidate division Zixibacteria bacterium]|nr:protein-export chaperone SecB [candidate division Zixibacteria bacterium]